MKNLNNFLICVLLAVGANAQIARVQVVHNCADAIASQVDVYVNGLLQLDNVPFRTASPFADLPADVSVIVSIAPGDSSSVLDAFHSETFNLTPDETYLIVADGIESTSGYNPSPPFSLEVYDMAREFASNPIMVDVLVHQGATDLPSVDVYETAQGFGLVLEDVVYPEFEGYLEFPVADYVVQLNDQTGTPIAAYVAPLEAFGLEGEAVTVVGSGFFDPSQNSNGPAFGLYAVPTVGGPLIPLPPSPILAIGDAKPVSVSAFPNPTSGKVYLDGLEHGTYMFRILDSSGRVLVELPNSTETTELDLGEFSSGIYFLSIIDTEERAASFTLVRH